MAKTPKFNDLLRLPNHRDRPHRILPIGSWSEPVDYAGDEYPKKVFEMALLLLLLQCSFYGQSGGCSSRTSRRKGRHDCFLERGFHLQRSTSMEKKGVVKGNLFQH
ncbi:uncharacterized protein LOC125556039 isoform X2 [Triticum urartu]|uniref:uncharacterized protein LOC125556039 isoform X2 n=1 Tax=Triticum urartu TaxID=4572 RepID=UPI0020431391|nr:uncharacterized protein LOC125556039 isoform X2 [Triticum urartu]